MMNRTVLPMIRPLGRMTIRPFTTTTFIPSVTVTVPAASRHWNSSRVTPLNNHLNLMTMASNRSHLSFNTWSQLKLTRSLTTTNPLHATDSTTHTTQSPTQKSEEKKTGGDESSQKKSGGGFSGDSWTKFVGTVGAIANWAIPLAAITHMMSSKDPATTIDPVMTSALAVYSVLFMRWAIAVSPANYPLLFCHICNEIAQLIQLGRYVNGR